MSMWILTVQSKQVANSQILSQMSFVVKKHLEVKNKIVELGFADALNPGLTNNK